MQFLHSKFSGGNSPRKLLTALPSVVLSSSSSSLSTKYLHRYKDTKKYKENAQLFAVRLLETLIQLCQA